MCHFISLFTSYLLHFIIIKKLCFSAVNLSSSVAKPAVWHLIQLLSDYDIKVLNLMTLLIVKLMWLTFPNNSYYIGKLSRVVMYHFAALLLLHPVVNNFWPQAEWEDDITKSVTHAFWWFIMTYRWVVPFLCELF